MIIPGASASPPPDLPPFFSKNMKSMRKTAPKRVAFALTSKSSGKLTPKMSASVNISLPIPAHSLEILPTSVCPSTDKTLNSTSLPQQLHVQNGPSIFKIGFSPASLIVYFGYKQDQFCSTVPMRLPGGLDTSIVCRQHGKRQELHLKGRFK